MRLATWNVNSLKVRLPHLTDWLAKAQPDVVCLQELKLEDAKFPRADLEAAGYQAAFSGQKTYNGVAILARAGQRFRDEILAVGGSRPAAESFRAFRGREPRVEALLRHNGMIAAQVST